MIRPVGYDSDSNKVSELICGICKSAKSQYSCPNCSILYCSSACYNSAKHTACSEKFYNETIQEHLKQGEKYQPTAEEINDRKKLVTLIHKYNSNNAPEGEENKDREWRYNVPQGVEESLKSLEAGFKASDVHRLNKAVTSSGHDDDDDDRPLTQHENQELEEIVNDASTEELLSMLSPEQRKDFELLVKGSNYVVDDS